MDGISASGGRVQEAVTLSVMKSAMGQGEEIMDTLMEGMVESLDAGVSSTLGTNIDYYV